MVLSSEGGTRVELSKEKVITERFQFHDRFAEITLRITGMLEPQIIFINHVEETKLSAEYTAAILEGVREEFTTNFGLRIALIDAVEHPIDSSVFLFKRVTKRALQKALARGEPEPSSL